MKETSMSMAGKHLPLILFFSSSLETPAFTLKWMCCKLCLGGEFHPLLHVLLHMIIIWLQLYKAWLEGWFEREELHGTDDNCLIQPHWRQWQQDQTIQKKYFILNSHYGLSVTYGKFLPPDLTYWRTHMYAGTMHFSGFSVGMNLCILSPFKKPQTTNRELENLWRWHFGEWRWFFLIPLVLSSSNISQSLGSSFLFCILFFSPTWSFPSTQWEL